MLGDGFFAVATKAVQIKAVVSQFIAQGLGNFSLLYFNHFVGKFIDLTAFHAHDMVMVLA
jgi:hypothetical protein